RCSSHLCRSQFQRHLPRPRYCDRGGGLRLVPTAQRAAALSAAPHRPTGRCMSALLQVHGLGKRFGGFVALDGIDLEVAEGERVGLIGPNGSGKSTLVNCLCGTLANETGSGTFQGPALPRVPAHAAPPPRAARRAPLA